MKARWSEGFNSFLSIALIVIFSSIFVGCGGSGGGGKNDGDKGEQSGENGGDTPRELPSFTITTQTSSGGSISPASIKLAKGGSTTFTLTPDTGYELDSVTGCGGSLSTNTYSVSNISADCTVEATFTTVKEKVSGKLITGLATNLATVSAFDDQGELLDADIATDTEGNFKASLPDAFTGSQLILVATVNNANTELRAICDKSNQPCLITPYTALKHNLANTLTGTEAERSAKASDIISTRMGLVSDPFATEDTAVKASVNYTAWANLVSSGALFNNWLQTTVLDIADNYLDEDEQGIFTNAVKRQPKTVVESSITIDKETQPIIDTDENTAEQSALSSLPEGTKITRSLYSLQSGEKGESVTTNDYLADLAYLEDQTYEDTDGTEIVDSRLVYLGFNLGRWKGQLNTETTLLTQIFLRNSSLIFVNDDLKVKGAEALVKDPEFKLAIDLYNEEIKLSENQDPEQLEYLLDSLANKASGFLTESQKDITKRQVLIKLNTNHQQYNASRRISAQSSFGIQSTSNQFTVFDGLTFQDDPSSTDSIKACSNSSLWYGVQLHSEFAKADKSVFDNFATTELIDPKVGLINKLTECLESKITPTGTNPVPSKITDIVVYRNHPDDWLDAPAVMNTLTVAELALKTAGVLAKNLKFDNKKVKKALKTYKNTKKKIDKFKEDYKEPIEDFFAVVDVSTDILSFYCSAFQYCPSNLNRMSGNISKVKKSFESIYNIKSSKIIAKDYDENNFKDLKAGFLKPYLASLFAKKDSKKVKKYKKNVRKVLPVYIAAELFLRPMYKSLKITTIKDKDIYKNSYDLLYNRNKFLKENEKHLAQLFNNGYEPKNLKVITHTISSLAKAPASIIGVVKGDKGGSVTGIVTELIVSNFESSKLIAGLVSTAVKAITPAKFLDIAAAADTGAALAYDYFTDPSLVKMGVQKVDGKLIFSHKIPKIEQIRYLNITDDIAWNHLVDYYVPGSGQDNRYQTSFRSKNKKSNDYLLGSLSEDNHFLVMSGFKGSIENQAVFDSSSQTKEVMDSLIEDEKIKVKWHVAKLSDGQDSRDLKLNQRKDATAFKSNNKEFTYDTGFWFWQDGIIGVKVGANDKSVQSTLLEAGKYNMIEFSEVYNDLLIHTTTGVFSDYTNIKIENGTDEVIFENTINFYVLPDFTELETNIKKYGVGLFESQDANKNLEFTLFKSSYNNLIENGDYFYITLMYKINNKPQYLKPIRVDLNSPNTTVQLPLGVSKDQLYFALFNKDLKNYADRTGQNVTGLVNRLTTYNRDKKPLVFFKLTNADISRVDSPDFEFQDSDDDGYPDSWDAFPFDAKYKRDSDNDGLPDQFEFDNGLDLNDPVDAQDDLDKDGITNLGEFLANTNVNASNIPTLESVESLLPEKPSVKVSWKADATSKIYNLYYSKTSFEKVSVSAANYGDNVTLLAGIDGSEKIIDDLEEGATYYFVVTSVADTGAESTQSSQKSVTLKQLTPPTKLTAVAQGDSAINVSWDAVEGAASYNLYYAEASFEGVDISNYASVQGAVLLTNITGAQKTITGLSQGKTYYVVATSVDSNGIETAKSNEVAVGLFNDIKAGLVAHYKFDGNANDSSGAGNNGAEVGGVTYVDGLNGKAVKLDGVDDYISTTASDNYPYLTVSAWVKINNSDTFGAIWSKYDPKDKTGKYSYSLVVKDKASFARFHTSNNTDFIEGSISDNKSEWYFVLGSWDGNTARLYINGQLIKQKTGLTLRSNDTFWNIGRSPREENYLDGLIDDLRIYNRALSEPEIQELYSTDSSVVSIKATKINDTGITLCGTADGTSNKTDCSTAVANATGSQVPLGQDGYYGTGKNGFKGMVFTKVKGYEGQCVQDEHTGLMWEVKQTEEGLHNKDNTYTWYNPDSSTNGGIAGKQNGGTCNGSDCDTYAFVKAVNEQGLCGYKDWRVPNREELRSIVDYGRMKPSIDSDFFPNTLTTFSLFWTSSNAVTNRNTAWAISFVDADDTAPAKDYKYNLRLVRAK